MPRKTSARLNQEARLRQIRADLGSVDIEAIGREIWGERWMWQMAELFGRSLQTVRNWVARPEGVSAETRLAMLYLRSVLGSADAIHPALEAVARQESAAVRRVKAILSGTKHRTGAAKVRAIAKLLGVDDEA